MHKIKIYAEKNKDFEVLRHEWRKYIKDNISHIPTQKRLIRYNRWSSLILDDPKVTLLKTDEKKLLDYFDSKKVKEIKSIIQSYLLEKKHFTCPYCWTAYLFWKETQSIIELDHYLPKNSRSKKTWLTCYPWYAWNPYNLIPVCKNCNSKKSDKIPQAWINAVTYLSEQEFNFWDFVKHKRDNKNLITCKTDWSWLIKKCNIADRYYEAKSQSNLQVMLEDIQNESSFYWTSPSKIIYMKTIQSNEINSEPFAHFNNQFYKRPPLKKIAQRDYRKF